MYLFHFGTHFRVGFVVLFSSLALFSTSPALESSSLKKSPVLLQCPQCPRAWPFRGVSCVCGLCPNLVAELCLPSLQPSAMALFAFRGQGRVPVVLMGQCGATLDLRWVRAGLCQSCSGCRLSGTFCVLSFEKPVLVGLGLRLQSAGMLAVFPSPQGRHHFGGDAGTVPRLWQRFRWALAKTELEGWVAQEHMGAGHVVLAMSTRASCGSGLAAWVCLRGRVCRGALLASRRGVFLPHGSSTCLRIEAGWGSWAREMVPAIRLFLEKCPKDPCFSGTHFEIRKQIFLPCSPGVLHPAASVPFLHRAAFPLRVGPPCLSLSSSPGVTPADFFRVACVQPH